MKECGYCVASEGEKGTEKLGRVGPSFYMYMGRDPEAKLDLDTPRARSYFIKRKQKPCCRTSCPQRIQGSWPLEFWTQSYRDVSQANGLLDPCRPPRLRYNFVRQANFIPPTSELEKHIDVVMYSFLLFQCHVVVSNFNIVGILTNQRMFCSRSCDWSSLKWGF